MCATSLGWRHLLNTDVVKAGWFIPFVDKRGTWVAGKTVWSLLHVPFLGALEVVYDDALYKSTVTLLYFTVVPCIFNVIDIKRVIRRGFTFLAHPVHLCHMIAHLWQHLVQQLGMPRPSSCTKCNSPLNAPIMMSVPYRRHYVSTHESHIVINYF